jgi:AcrR family transcriptional regulator
MGILAGARATIIQGGVRRMTMSAVAERGGVAKATVYNHFRSRGELLDGLLADELARLLQKADDAGPSTVEQLTAVAQSIARNPLLDAIRQHEPEVLAGLTGFAGPEVADRWADVIVVLRARLAEQGVRSDEVAVDLLLRWLLSVVLAPASSDRIAAEATLLAVALAVTEGDAE